MPAYSPRNIGGSLRFMKHHLVVWGEKWCPSRTATEATEGKTGELEADWTHEQHSPSAAEGQISRSPSFSASPSNSNSVSTDCLLPPGLIPNQPPPSSFHSGVGSNGDNNFVGRAGLDTHQTAALLFNPENGPDVHASLFPGVGMAQGPPLVAAYRKQTTCERPDFPSGFDRPSNRYGTDTLSQYVGGNEDSVALMAPIPGSNNSRIPPHIQGHGPRGGYHPIWPERPRLIHPEFDHGIKTPYPVPYEEAQPFSNDIHPWISSGSSLPNPICPQVESTSARLLGSGATRLAASAQNGPPAPAIHGYGVGAAHHPCQAHDFYYDYPPSRPAEHLGSLSHGLDVPPGNLDFPQGQMTGTVGGTYVPNYFF